MARDADEAGADPTNPVDTDEDGTPDYLDLDGDGVADDADSTVVDTDADGTPDAQDLDSDNDGILDEDEAGPDPLNPVDTDEDGTPDYLDLDSDDDGILDITESGNTDLDADNDGTIDAMDDPATGDLDGDGVADDVVADLNDADNDGVPDFQEADSDGDGIPDAVEAGPDPLNPVDTDLDGIPDYLDLDSDNDGIPDVIENGGADLDVDGNGTIDSMDDPATGDLDGDGVADNAPPLLDSDNDGIPDSVEAGPDPLNPVDTDEDGTPDYQDEDSDNDGIPDSVEAGPDPFNPLDADEDGIPDYQDPDSDGDGIPDSIEAGPDPTDPRDTDNDGVPDFIDLDADGDGLPDAAEGDVTEGTDGYLTDFDGDGIPDWIDPVESTVSGHVYHDENRNGIKDDGEQDISGIDVELFAAGPDGQLDTSDDVLLRTDTTASPYELVDVPAGTYLVVADVNDVPSGYFITTNSDGEPEYKVVVVVTDGQDVLNVDFGEAFAAITGTFTDSNGEPAGQRRYHRDRCCRQ